MGATLKSNITQITRGMRRRTHRLVRETALSIEGDVKQQMAEGKSGRTYRRGEKTHTASAPGEAPAIDNSVLVNSVQAVPVDETSAAVGSNSEYAPVLELGGAHVEPRPSFGPAFERAEEQFQAGLREIFEG